MVTAMDGTTETRDDVVEGWYRELDGLPGDFAAKVDSLPIDVDTAGRIAARADPRMHTGPIGRALDLAYGLIGPDARRTFTKAELAGLCGTTVEALESAWHRGGWGYVYE